MNTEKRNHLERQLLQTLLLYRYEEEIHSLQLEYADSCAKAAKEEEKKGLAKAFGEIVSKLTKPKESALDTLNKAKANRDAFAATLSPEIDQELALDEEDLRQIVDEHFARDNLSKRLAMGLELVLAEADPNFPRFLRPEESRKKLSSLLFGQEETLGKMLEVYVYSVSVIEGKKLPKQEDRNESLGATLGAIGAGVGVFGLFTGVGLLLGTAIGLTGLAMLGIAKKRKKDAKNAGDDLLLFSSFILNADAKKKRFGRLAARRLRKAGRAIDKQGYVFALASAITIFNFRFEDKRGDLAKEAMSSMLERIDALRGDAEYFALVERHDHQQNHQKFLCCNRAVELLYHLVEADMEKRPQEEETIIVEPVNA